MAKRRLSAFNIRMRSLLKRGVPFAQAARRASGKTLKTVRSTVMPMARRRRSRGSFRTSRRRSGGMRGFGGIVGMATTAGMAYAVGAGVQTLFNKYGAMFNLPVAQFSPFVGAGAAFVTGKGLPGLVAAAPFILNGRMAPNNAVQQQAGFGAFV